MWCFALVYRMMMNETCAVLACWCGELLLCSKKSWCQRGTSRGGRQGDTASKSALKPFRTTTNGTQWAIVPIIRNTRTINQYHLQSVSHLAKLLCMNDHGLVQICFFEMFGLAVLAVISGHQSCADKRAQEGKSSPLWVVPKIEDVTLALLFDAFFTCHKWH